MWIDKNAIVWLIYTSLIGGGLFGCRSTVSLNLDPKPSLDQSSEILGTLAGGPTMQTFGHRGASAAWPENTLGSVKSALETVQGAEIDIQLTKDNVLIVLHDDTLRRTASIWPQKNPKTSCWFDSPVNTLNWRQIKPMIVGLQGETIPTLGNMVRLLAQYPQKKLLIEIKSYSTGLAQDTVALASLLKALNNFFSPLSPQIRSQLILISFDEEVLKGIKQNPNLKDLESYLLFTGKSIMEFYERGQLNALLEKSTALSGLDIESGSYLYQPLVNGKNIVDLIKARQKKVITWISRGHRTDGLYWQQVSKTLGVSIFTSDLPLSLLVPKRNQIRYQQTLDFLKGKDVKVVLPTKKPSPPGSTTDQEELIFQGFSADGKTYRIYLPLAGDFPGLTPAQWKEAITKDLEAYGSSSDMKETRETKELGGVVINLSDLTALEKQSFVLHLKNLPKNLTTNLIIVDPNFSLPPSQDISVTNIGIANARLEATLTLPASPIRTQ